MEDFLFVLGSNFRLSIAELDNILKNYQFKRRIKDYKNAPNLKPDNSKRSLKTPCSKYSESPQEKPTL